ncbi:MAG: divergent polysaccharide deacetylase family protein [Kordiimonadaceae bacterium]|jgi:uncharacterized protein|nr:divergent polysaccharide deacetylase family protein [Kordiimonadaceae bacterium]MBT6035937.1 divergent polysaccharide deacetylase family protein [Kordiimonadaceae bacterium]MBT7583065.1 divergent polysaccharide deacetylase family protein [Kordiimonadaceae bacterium]
MADEPELKTTTRQRVLNPLLMAWGLVVILLSLTVAWVYLSDDPAENIELVPEPQIVATQEESGSTVVMDLPEQQEEQEVPINAPAEIDEPPVQSTPQISSTSIPETQVNQSDLSLAETQTPLSQVPNDNLVMQGDNGLLPVMGPDGLIAWKEYARPFQETDTAPRISILITDVGLNTKSSTAAIDTLPGQIDLGFSAYGRNLQNWMDKSRAKGHEAFLMIPTEPINYPDNDPGPHTLIAEATERDNLLRLNWLLSQVTGYVGVVNHMGSKFTASEEALTPVLTDLQSRGLMLIDSRSTRFSMAARTARRLNMPRAINDRYIDNVITSEEIQRQLAELENTATTFGAALGLARATPLTINEIARWSMSLSEKGIELVPITAIANRQPIK